MLQKEDRRKKIEEKKIEEVKGNAVTYTGYLYPPDTTFAVNTSVCRKFWSLNMTLLTAREQLLGRLNDTPFILTVSGRRELPEPDNNVREWLSLPEPPRKIILRTIMLHDKPHLQINAYTSKQHFTKNIPVDEIALDTVLAQILAEPFTQAHAQMPEADFYARILSRGETETLSTKSTKPSRQAWEETHHDSEKNYLLTPGNAAPLLRALGIAGENGSIRAPMQAKYRQINHFLSIATQLDAVQNNHTLRIVDCGCGKAYLSLALYYVLTVMMGKTVELTGIDTNQQVIEFCNRTARTLHFDTANFLCMPISDYSMDGTADMVIALHACDTATDDALALALRMQARAVLAAPCCHHYVNAQLRSTSAPNDVALLLQDGITRERLADLLTDSMRRDILKAYGYSASLMEFVAPEHTTKNILIRAEHPLRPSSPDDSKLQRVRDDMQRWNTGPKLVEMLEEKKPEERI